MTEYTYEKYCNSGKLAREIAATPYLSHITTTPTHTTIHTTASLSGGEETTLSGLITAHTTTDSQAAVEQVILNAILFGQQLVTTFAAENVLMGITQAGMTRTVRLITHEVVASLGTGSLYDALQCIRDIDPADYDATFITEARLLAFLNKIEVYLGITPSTEL
jgi:hypothetical protein